MPAQRTGALDVAEEAGRGRRDDAVARARALGSRDRVGVDRAREHDENRGVTARTHLRDRAEELG